MHYVRTAGARFQQDKPGSFLQSPQAEGTYARQPFGAYCQSGRKSDKLIHEIPSEQRGRKSASAFAKDPRQSLLREDTQRIRSVDLRSVQRASWPCRIT